MWGTENFSAARTLPAPKNDLAYQKYDTHTTQKSYPRGVQFYGIYYRYIIFALYDTYAYAMPLPFLFFPALTQPHVPSPLGMPAVFISEGPYLKRLWL
jgi:hypothetical protein